MALSLGFGSPCVSDVRFASSPRNRHGRLVLAVRNAAGDDSKAGGADASKRFSIPKTLEESVAQARTACRQALRDGHTRLQLEMPLPLIGATEVDNWPGGIQQEFRAASPMVSSLLVGLVPGEGKFKVSIFDRDDVVGLWQNEEIALVLFPSADSLSRIEKLASIAVDRPLVFMNVQWQEGQVISEFGFGAGKKRKEDFVKTFLMVYYLQQLRVSGDTVRILKCYPGDWQVFLTESSGGSKCIAVEAEKPSYKRLEMILKETQGTSSANNNWFARIAQEFKFNSDSMK